MTRRSPIQLVASDWFTIRGHGRVAAVDLRQIPGCPDPLRSAEEIPIRTGQTVVIDGTGFEVRRVEFSTALMSPSFIKPTVGLLVKELPTTEEGSNTMGFTIKSDDLTRQTFLAHANGTTTATSWPELNQLQADIRDHMYERGMTMSDAFPRRPLVDDPGSRNREDRERRIWELQAATKYETVCICGSMKFYDHMLRVAERLTLDGLIVLLPLVRKDQAMTTENLAHQSQMQRTLPEGMAVDVVLDAMHRAKIKMSSRIVVCTNAVGYFGESTNGEIQYAASLDKTIEFVRDTRGPEAGDEHDDVVTGVR